MAFKSKDGKNNNSKFRANRRDKAAQDGMKSVSDGGPRSQANAIEGKKAPASREETSKPAPVSGGASDTGGPVNAQGGMTMGAKARELHLTHDDNMGHHTVHAIMDNGEEQMTQHPTREHAHKHAAKLAGAHTEPDEDDFGKREEDEAENPPDADDYDVQPLD